MSMERTRINVVTSAMLVLVALACGGCATGGVPKSMRAGVRPGVAFKDVLKAPDSFKGTTVMWAGRILSVKNDKDGTTLQIIQTPSGSDGRPLMADQSEGRFMARVNQYLDRVVYHVNREVTVIGQVDGAIKQPLAEGEMEYAYPYVVASYVKLWPAETPVRGGRWGYGDPYMYGPYGGPAYDDFWYRPFPDRVIIERREDARERMPSGGEARRDRR